MKGAKRTGENRRLRREVIIFLWLLLQGSDRIPFNPQEHDDPSSGYSNPLLITKTHFPYRSYNS